MRYALEIAFKGKAYHGWQIQENAHSVQEELESALAKVCGVKTETTGCGRTDTGVHALQFFVHFDLEEEADPELVYKLNKILPQDIAAKGIRQVSGNFHARFSCSSRKYEYWINRKKNPFLTEWAYYRYGPLDVASMEEAAQRLLSFSDFKTFSKSRTQVKTFRCRVMEAIWEERMAGELLVFTIKADRFLRNMVRAIVGTLLDVGKGVLAPEQLDEVMRSGNRSNAGLSVPAHGLYLAEVEYEWTKFEPNG